MRFLMEINGGFFNRFRDLQPKKEDKKTPTKLSGEVISRDSMKYMLNVNTREFSGFSLPEPEYFRKEYVSTLELLYGVRDKKAQKILECGVKNLTDASGHETYGKEARLLISAVDSGLPAVRNVLSSRLSPSHRLFFLLLSFFKPEELLFVDIETKSLHIETSIIEIGAGYFEGNKFTVKQFTALTDSSEYLLLEEFAKLLPGKKAFVTFNGRTFDIPFIDGRMAYYGGPGIPVEITSMHNFDLLHFSRRCYRREFDSYSLKAMEAQVLGKERDGDINGDEVHIYFEDFLATQNPEYIEPIVYHNREDIFALVQIMKRLLDRWIK
jgi:uncharacterized protein YprB with RNaseH-like and TPR domain